jgi:hypothetical protein
VKRILSAVIRKLAIPIFAASVAASALGQDVKPSLEAGFVTPPNSAKLRV